MLIVPTGLPCAESIEVHFLDASKPPATVTLHGPEARSGGADDRWWFAIDVSGERRHVDNFPSREIVQVEAWWYLVETVGPITSWCPAFTADQLHVALLEAGHDVLAAQVVVERFGQGAPRWDAAREVLDATHERAEKAAEALAKVRGYGEA
jgi:hypothetical protein